MYRCRHCVFRTAFFSLAIASLSVCMQTMPTKEGRCHKNVSIVTHKPTAADLQEAHRLFASMDAKKKKHAQTAFNQFLKGNATAEGHADLLKNKTKKACYLVTYLAYQIANKAGRLRNERTHAASTAATTRFYEWTAWKIQQEQGPAVCKLWLESGKLDSIPDRLTGSDHEDHRIYFVPISWVDKEESDRTQVSLFGENDATEQDIINMGSMGMGSAASVGGGTGSDGSVPIKKEPGTGTGEVPKQTAQAEVASELASSVMQKIRGHSVDLTVLAATARQDKYAWVIGDDADELAKKFDKIAKSVEKLISRPEQVNVQAVGSLTTDLKILESEKDTITTAAQRFGIDSAKKRKRQ